MAEKTGTGILQEKLHVLARKGHLAPIARDLGLGVAALEEFTLGQA